MTDYMEKLGKFIRDVPDYPRPGIIYKDITPLLMNPDARRFVISSMEKEITKIVSPDVVAGIEARGWLFGPPLAHIMSLPFVPIRKEGNLPYTTVSETYDLEYGKDAIEVHDDAIKKGQKVLVVDDILATGGTALAAARLVERVQALPCFCFLIELDYLKGRQKLGKYKVISLLHYA